MSRTNDIFDHFEFRELEKGIDGAVHGAKDYGFPKLSLEKIPAVKARQIVEKLKVIADEIDFEIKTVELEEQKEQLKKQITRKEKELEALKNKLNGE